MFCLNINKSYLTSANPIFWFRGFSGISSYKNAWPLNAKLEICILWPNLKCRRCCSSYNVMCCSFQNWYLLEEKTISSHDHKTESCTSKKFFSKFPTNIWSILCGSSPREYSTRMGHASLLHITAYVRLPRLITTACLQGGKRHDRETPSRDQCAD